MNQKQTQGKEIFAGGFQNGWHDPLVVRVDSFGLPVGSNTSNYTFETPSGIIP